MVRPHTWLLLLVIALVSACTTEQSQRLIESPEFSVNPDEPPPARALCDFADPSELENWRLYEIEGDHNPPSAQVAGGVLHVHSDNAVGLFFRKVRVFPAHEPLLSWRWRVSRTFPESSSLSPELDNFPARVLVGFEAGWEGASAVALSFKRKVENAIGISPPARGVCYTFGGKTDRSVAIDALFGQGRIVIVNLRRDTAGRGRWFDEVRDIAADYRAIFGGDGAVPPVSTIAVSSDSDRMKVPVSADFADFRVHPAEAYQYFRNILGPPPRDSQAPPLARWLAASFAGLAALILGAWIALKRRRGVSEQA